MERNDVVGAGGACAEGEEEARFEGCGCWCGEDSEREGHRLNGKLVNGSAESDRGRWWNHIQRYHFLLIFLGLMNDPLCT